jgi:hypothetical protein
MYHYILQNKLGYKKYMYRIQIFVCMQLLLTTMRHFTIALCMSARLWISWSTIRALFKTFMHKVPRLISYLCEDKLHSAKCITTDCKINLGIIKQISHLTLLSLVVTTSTRVAWSNTLIACVLPKQSLCVCVFHTKSHPYFPGLLLPSG